LIGEGICRQHDIWEIPKLGTLMVIWNIWAKFHWAQHGLSVKRRLCRATRTPVQCSRPFMSLQVMSRSNGLTDCLNFIGGKKRGGAILENAIYLSSWLKATWLPRKASIWRPSFAS
jgi:hypothetical protein